MANENITEFIGSIPETELLTKQATTGTYGGIFTSGGAADAFGIPQEIIESLIQPSDILDVMSWEFNNQPSFPFDIFDSKMGADDGSFAEGGCPTTATHDIGRLTVEAKSFGSCSDHLTLPALASKQHQTPTPRNIRTGIGPTAINSEWEFQMFKVLQRIARIREYLAINGNVVVNANNFDGLLRIIRTGYLDINAQPIDDADSTVHDEGCTDVTVRKMEEVIGAMEDRYVDINDIKLIMRPGLFRHLAYLISLNYMDIEAKKQQLLAGRILPLGGADIPVLTTQFMPRTGSAQTWCSHILFITMNYLGIPSLYWQFFDFSQIVANYQDLFASPVGAGGLTPSPYVMFTRNRTGTTTCTSAQWCLFAHGRLVARAPQSLAKIEYVNYSALRERTVANP